MNLDDENIDDLSNEELEEKISEMQQKLVQQVGETV